MLSAVLVHQQDKQDPKDFEAILERVRSGASEVDGFIADSKTPDPELAERAYAQPAITISPMPIRRFVPLSGPVFQGHEYPKSEQYGRLRAGGIAVPDWEVIGPDIQDRLDPEDWGDYVIVKPDLGRKGSEIFIKRTRRVRYKPKEDHPEGHLLRKAPMVAQKFIYTGRWPFHYRIVTFFGKCIISWKVEQDHGFPPLESRFGFGGGGISVVSNKRSSSYSQTDRPEPIELAEAAHACFPELPLLGSDIVQDCETGEWYVLECNPRGDAWHLSSAIGMAVQSAHGIRAKEQYDWIGICADRVISQTRAFADTRAAENFSSE